MSWNWGLRDRFLEAGRLLNYEITCNWSYYEMKTPDDKIWCYLWHPLNKMGNLRDEESRPELALNHIKDNQDDFHIELDRDPRYGTSITYLFPELWDNPDTATIVQTILNAQNTELIAHLEFLAELRGEE